MKIQFLSGDSITAIKANLNGLRTKFGSGNEWVFNSLMENLLSKTQNTTLRISSLICRKTTHF